MKQLLEKLSHQQKEKKYAEINKTVENSKTTHQQIRRGEDYQT